MKKEGLLRKFVLLLVLLVTLPVCAQEGDDEGTGADGRRVTIRIRYRYPQYKIVRVHPLFLDMSADYDFYNIMFNYDYFNGNNSMFHLGLGYTPSENSSGADARGLTAKFLYGIVTKRKLYRDGALAFSWDIGAHITKANIDGDAWGSHYTGGLDNYEFRFGPRGDFFLRLLGTQPSLIDMWMSTYVHVLAGYKKFERFEDGSIDASSEGANFGFAWGFILSATLISIDMELGTFDEFFFRVGIGLAFSL